jgi:hypothetical protein
MVYEKPQVKTVLERGHRREEAELELGKGGDVDGTVGGFWRYSGQGYSHSLWKAVH